MNLINQYFSMLILNLLSPLVHLTFLHLGLAFDQLLLRHPLVLGEQSTCVAVEQLVWDVFRPAANACLAVLGG